MHFIRVAISSAACGADGLPESVPVAHWFYWFMEEVGLEEIKTILSQKLRPGGLNKGMWLCPLILD